MNNCSSHLPLQCVLCKGDSAAHPEVEDDNLVAHTHMRKRTLNFKKGQPVFLEGDECEGIYCLSKGIVAIRKYGSDGSSAVMKLIFPGQSFGYRPILFDQDHKTSAEALTPVSICLLPKHDVKHAIDNNPHERQKLLNLLEHDLDLMEEKLLLTVTKTIRSRFAYLLFSMSRHIQPHANQVTFSLPVSKKEISNITGITVESLSRLLKKFRDMELIEEDKGVVTILDRQALRDIIADD